jgi:hypothetical protein
MLAGPSPRLAFGLKANSVNLEIDSPNDDGASRIWDQRALMSRSLAIAMAMYAAGISSPALAQQANVGVPFNTGGSSFYEQFGVSWGLRGNGWFANFPGPPPAPPFGGFDPNAGANFGIAGPNGFLNFTAGQGANTTFTSQAPSVTVMNGATGFFSDTTLRPFVTGLIPVVGGLPVPPPIGPVQSAGPSVLEERLQRLQAAGGPSSELQYQPPAAAAPPAGSTADRGDLSVAEIKARQAADKAVRQNAGASEIAGLLAKANEAETVGKTTLAKMYLQMAARRSSGEQQRQIQTQLQRLESRAK